jgi:hypothetical protein
LDCRRMTGITWFGLAVAVALSARSAYGCGIRAFAALACRYLVGI